MSHDGIVCHVMEDKGKEILNVLDGPLAGTFEHALDPRKRITIPSVWREVMGGPAYVYVMPDPNETCLALLPPVVLQPRLERLRQQSLFDEALSEALAEFFGQAEYLAVDVQGRIRIGDALLGDAQIDTGVVLRGLGTRIQVWSTKLCPPRGGVNREALAQARRALGF